MDSSSLGSPRLARWSFHDRAASTALPQLGSGRSLSTVAKMLNRRKGCACSSECNGPDTVRRFHYALPTKLRAALPDKA